MDQIERVREFNRYYTQRLGVLSDHYLGGARPLGEARVLFEIGTCSDVRDLRARLGLDSGYLSRLLRKLTRQGMVSVGTHSSDRRVRTVSLTAAGKRERAELDARARDSVAEMLGSLSAGQRSRLVAAQDAVRRLLRAAAVTIASVPDDDPAARWCLERYAAELSVRFPSGYDSGALLPPGTLDGTFLLARESRSHLEIAAVGCGAWQRLPSPGAAEIRHLWVSESVRGLGLGRRLLAELEADAAASGIERVCLGTHRSLPEAISLYRSSGYEEIPPYGESGYNELNFGKRLTT
jgi:DNA-binding MarR family transcriptional regulator/GNAT superfamily N-acetyltransferase